MQTNCKGKDMPKYYSTGTCTSNELALYEVTMTYSNGFFADLFKMERISEAWERSDNGWRNKETLQLASNRKILEIQLIIDRNDCYTSDMYGY